MSKYQITKRRRLGRESVALLHRINSRVQEHCQKIPESVNSFGVPNPFGYRPHWPDDNDRIASILLTVLARYVETKEVYATEEGEFNYGACWDFLVKSMNGKLSLE